MLSWRMVPGEGAHCSVYEPPGHEKRLILLVYQVSRDRTRGSGIQSRWRICGGGWTAGILQEPVISACEFAVLLLTLLLAW